MNDFLTKFCNANHFKINKKMAYGIYHNRLISIIPSSSFIKVTITFNAPLTRENGSKLSSKISVIKASNRILQQGLTTNVSVELILYQSAELENEMIPVIEQVINAVNEFQPVGCETCPLCGRALPSNAPFIQIKDTVIQGHEECITQLVGASTQMQNSLENNEKKSFWFNILISIASMLVVCIAAIALSTYSFTYCISFSGWICFALAKYIISKSKKAFSLKSLIVLSIVSVLAMLIVSYFGVVVYLVKNGVFDLSTSLRNYIQILIDNRSTLGENFIISLATGVVILGLTIMLYYKQLKQMNSSVKRLN